MDLLVDVFGRLCGGGRCFVVDGEALPLCQRCLGLYLAAAVTGAWVAVGRLWRGGLPPRGVLVGHVLLLAGAILGGLHVIDAGPLWRLVCGLATGHVLLLWLAVGAGHLWRAGDIYSATRPRWGRWQTVPAVIVIVLLLIAGFLAALVPSLGEIGGAGGVRGATPPSASWVWTFWTVFAAIGLAVIAVGLCGAVVAVVRWAWRVLGSRRAR